MRCDRCVLARVNTVPFAHLQAFLTVARVRSFSGAARELGVSRSAVSQSVRQLEVELRVALVVRTTRSVSLTDAGRRLLESAGPAVAQMRAALVEVTAKPGEVVGRVRLTVPRAAFQLVIEPVLGKFRERHPRIDVELVFEDRRVDIVAEGYDAGIRLSDTSSATWSAFASPTLSGSSSSVLPVTSTNTASLCAPKISSTMSA
jgi:DNA-binding transcriptional LysR family regulator